MTAHSLAEAWAVEAKDRHATKTTPGYEDAKALFYTGAAAMLAMVAASGPDRHSLLGFLATIKAELEAYLDEEDRSNGI